jgi:meiosis induction protein kinase IME2/SME1
MLKRHHSTSSKEVSTPSIRQVLASHKSQSNINYDTPDEEDEILHESLMSARNANKSINTQVSPAWKTSSSLLPSPSTQESKYLTPAPSANRSSIHYGHTDYNHQSRTVDSNKLQQPGRWPTPPYEDNEWTNSVAASLYQATSGWR